MFASANSWASPTGCIHSRTTRAASYLQSLSTASLIICWKRFPADSPHVDTRRLPGSSSPRLFTQFPQHVASGPAATWLARSSRPLVSVHVVWLHGSHYSSQPPLCRSCPGPALGAICSRTAFCSVVRISHPCCGLGQGKYFYGMTNNARVWKRSIQFIPAREGKPLKYKQNDIMENW